MKHPNADNHAHNRAWIQQNIPHQGSMCLLDSVVEWSPQRIVCLANSHRAPTNPLRRQAQFGQAQLGIANAIEYAAQAMAVHGALLAAPAETGSPARLGYLASVRNVTFFADRLDDIAEDLRIIAERLSGNDTQVLYEFVVSATVQPIRRLAEGRATVILDAEKYL